MSSNITVNGVPLEVHVDKEIRKEIDEVRQSENRIRRYRSPRAGANVSLTNPNKSTRGAGLDLRTTHVMIYGQLWEPAAKAPYTASGESISGAFEINETTNEIKCHECGSWRPSVVGKHVRDAHAMDMKSYLKRHGLSTSSKVSTPAYRKTRSPVTHTQSESDREKNRLLAIKKRGTLFAHGKIASYSITEQSNLHARCKEQYTWRIRDLAKELNRKPTIREFASRKIFRAPVERAFALPFRMVVARVLGVN